MDDAMPRLIKPLLFVLALAAVTGCGRKAPLDPPNAAAPAATAEQPKPAADKPFVLDPLIN
jgi:predicted small lipoprotein YifL